MSSLKTRLLTAVVGIPIILLLIFLPYGEHIALSIMLVLVNALGVYELHFNLLKKKVDVPPTGLLGVFLPLVELVQIRCFPNSRLTAFTVCALLTIAFFVEIFNGAKDNFEKSLERIATAALNIIYPGYFMAFFIRIGHLPNVTSMMIIFLVFVFGSDSLAYFSGMLFGKNNKGFVKCSPNKSFAGFIGGTVLVGVIAFFIPMIWKNFLPFTSIQLATIAFVTAVFGTSGDLFESMLKRACGVKDSGVIIPGRGGMLDCIDSISIAAPIFIILCEAFI